MKFLINNLHLSLSLSLYTFVLGSTLPVKNTAEETVQIDHSEPRTENKFHDDSFDIKSSDLTIFDIRTLLNNLYQNTPSRQFEFSPTLFDYDVTELIQTNRIAKRQHFVRNRRLMSDCLGSCYRRMQSLIKCKQLCF